MAIKRPYPAYVGTIEEELAFLKAEKLVPVRSSHEENVSRVAKRRRVRRTMAMNALETFLKSKAPSRLQKMLVKRDINRILDLDAPFPGFSHDQEKLVEDLMRQTDPCSRKMCGHTLMMHSGGKCLACTHCRSFVSMPSKELATERWQYDDNENDSTIESLEGEAN